MHIIPGDLSHPSVIALLGVHLESARAVTPAGSAHALDLSGLRSPDISFWSIWDGEALAGVGALRRFAPNHGEIKSMHTAQSARRRGVARAMLLHLLAEARAGGLSRLSLETGSFDYFRPARALYAGHGFVECPPFGNYRPDPNSVFMTLDLATAPLGRGERDPAGIASPPW